MSRCQRRRQPHAALLGLGMLMVLVCSSARSHALCGPGTLWADGACRPDTTQLCAPPTVWNQDRLSCRLAAGYSFRVSNRARPDGDRGIAGWYVPSTTFQLEDAVVQTFAHFADSVVSRALARIDNAEGCGWQVRERIELNDDCCRGQPVLADCWEWRVVLTSNVDYLRSSLCTEPTARNLTLYDPVTMEETVYSLLVLAHVPV